MIDMNVLGNEVWVLVYLPPASRMQVHVYGDVASAVGRALLIMGEAKVPVDAVRRWNEGAQQEVRLWGWDNPAPYSPSQISVEPVIVDPDHPLLRDMEPTKKPVCERFSITLANGETIHQDGEFAVRDRHGGNTLRVELKHERSFIIKSLLFPSDLRSDEDALRGFLYNITSFTDTNINGCWYCGGVGGAFRDDSRKHHANFGYCIRELTRLCGRG